MHFSMSILLLLLTSNIEMEQAVDSVSNFADLISKYGPFVVILAVFIVILIGLVITMIYMNRKLIGQAIDNHTQSEDFTKELSSKIVNSFLSDHNLHIEEEVHHKNLVGEYLNINSTLSDASKAASQSLSCSRISIYVFHNGNKSLFGLPFFKVSCIHEYTNSISGLSIRGKNHVDMPLHLFSDFIDPLWKFGFYRSENINISIQKDHSLAEFTSYSNTKSIYLVAIKNNNITTGFIAAEFDNIDTFETDPTRDIEVKSVLDYMSLQISPIINSYNNYKLADHNKTDGSL